VSTSPRRNSSNAGIRPGARLSVSGGAVATHVLASRRAPVTIRINSSNEMAAATRRLGVPAADVDGALEVVEDRPARPLVERVEAVERDAGQRHGAGRVGTDRVGIEVRWTTPP
jgi:hypothetical protein